MSFKLPPADLKINIPSLTRGRRTDDPIISAGSFKIQSFIRFVNAENKDSVLYPLKRNIPKRDVGLAILSTSGASTVYPIDHSISTDFLQRKINTGFTPSNTLKINIPFQGCRAGDSILQRGNTIIYSFRAVVNSILGGVYG